MGVTYCYECKHARMITFEGEFTNQCPFAVYNSEVQRGRCDKYEMVTPVRVRYYNAKGVLVGGQTYLRREDINEKRIQGVAKKCNCTYKIENIT